MLVQKGTIRSSTALAFRPILRIAGIIEANLPPWRVCACNRIGDHIRDLGRAQYLYDYPEGREQLETVEA